MGAEKINYESDLDNVKRFLQQKNFELQRYLPKNNVQIEWIISEIDQGNHVEVSLSIPLYKINLNKQNSNPILLINDLKERAIHILENRTLLKVVE